MLIVTKPLCAALEERVLRSEFTRQSSHIRRAVKLCCRLVRASACRTRQERRVPSRGDDRFKAQLRVVHMWVEELILGNLRPWGQHAAF